METIVKNVESLKNEIPYALFNRSGIRINEKFIEEVSKTPYQKTIINGIEFTTIPYNKEQTKICFRVKMRSGNTRSNTSQTRNIV